MRTYRQIEGPVVMQRKRPPPKQQRLAFPSFSAAEETNREYWRIISWSRYTGPPRTWIIRPWVQRLVVHYHFPSHLFFIFRCGCHCRTRYNKIKSEGGQPYIFNYLQAFETMAKLMFNPGQQSIFANQPHPKNPLAKTRMINTKKIGTERPPKWYFKQR